MTRQHLVVAALIMLSGCAHSKGADEAPPPAVLRVDNQGALDITVFVMRSGSERIRLGVAGRLKVTDLPIRSNVMVAGAGLRFVGEPIGTSPIGTNRTSVSTVITVSPGDTVTWTVRPGFY